MNKNFSKVTYHYSRKIALGAAFGNSSASCPECIALSSECCGCPGKPENTLRNNIKGTYLTKTSNLDAQFWECIDWRWKLFREETLSSIYIESCII